MDADYECMRCGEVVSSRPTCHPWQYGWVHRDPMACIRYREEQVRKETEARVRAEMAAAAAPLQG